MIRIARPPPVKHWTQEDNTVLEQALTTGYLPDGRIATQCRMAQFLGFSRQAVVNHLENRVFPLHTELKREGGRQSAYKRRLARLETIRLHTGGR